MDKTHIVIATFFCCCGAVIYDMLIARVVINTDFLSGVIALGVSLIIIHYIINRWPRLK